MWGQRQERVGERKVETKEGSADFRCYFRVSPRNACNEFPYITIRTAPLFTSLLSVPCTGFHIINLESSGISLNASVSPVFPSCQLLSLDKEITPFVCRGMQSGFELSKRIDRTSTPVQTGSFRCSFIRDAKFRWKVFSFRAPQEPHHSGAKRQSERGELWR